MNAKKIFISAMIIGSLLLGGCVATPYYGSSGYMGKTVYGTSYPSYFGNFGYAYRQPVFRGHIHFGNGHRHFIGGHGHHGHRHFGRGHGHGGHRVHRW